MENKFKKGDELVVMAEIIDTKSAEDVLLQIDKSHYSNLPGFPRQHQNYVTIL